MSKTKFFFQIYKPQHEDVQALRDDFVKIKEMAHSGDDPKLKEKVERNGRRRSLTDEVKMRNIERAVRGDGVQSSEFYFIF